MKDQLLPREKKPSFSEKWKEYHKDDMWGKFYAWLKSKSKKKDKKK